MSDPFVLDTEAISIAIALGAEVGAIPGSRLYQALVFWSDYRETSLGYFGNEVGAQNKVMEWAFAQTEWDSDSDMPWGKRPRKNYPTGAVNLGHDLVEWNSARKEWFTNNSFENILEWFNEAEFGENANIEIVVHVVDFSRPIEYVTKGTWSRRDQDER